MSHDCLFDCPDTCDLALSQVQCGVILLRRFDVFIFKFQLLHFELDTSFSTSALSQTCVLVVCRLFSLVRVQWSELPSLPVEKSSVTGVCYVVPFKDLLVVATTVRCDKSGRASSSSVPANADVDASSGGGQARYRAAVFACDASLRRWQPIAGPEVFTSHTVDGLCVEQMRSKLMLILRQCRKSDGPNTVWTLDSESSSTGVLSAKSSWSPHCIVPAGHRCGSYAVVGNFLVAAGGKIGGSDSAAQRTVDAYDFTLNDWISWPSLPYALYAAAPAVFNENFLVLCGGVLGQSIMSKASGKNLDQHPEMGRFESLAIEVHGDFPASGWTVHCYMKCPNLSPSAANVHGMLAVHNGGAVNSGDVSWWDTGKREWRRITKLPEACVDSAIVEFGGSLVVVGGEEVHAINSVGGEDYERSFSIRVFGIKTIK